jgi:hypothetical protein
LQIATGEEYMDQQNVEQRFDEIIHPRVTNQVIKQKRPPAKFPELRYLWGITLLGSFILVVVASTISTLIHPA